MIDDEFTRRVLDSMSFNTFVAERGKPYRVCDIFDEVSQATLSEAVCLLLWIDVIMFWSKHFTKYSKYPSKRLPYVYNNSLNVFQMIYERFIPRLFVLLS